MDAVSSVTKKISCCGEEYRMTGVLPENRQKIIDIARTWIGTPYRHQSSIKGEGCDCVGMVRGVYREFFGVENDPENMPPYQPNWYEVDQKDPLLLFGRRHLEEVPFEEMMPSDILVFRMKRGVSAKHCGIITSTDTMVHAYSKQKVYEVSLGDQWLRKVAAVLRFPCPEDEV
jgi:NlpC/P60 family putative phage cell wall peptidase